MPRIREQLGDEEFYFQQDGAPPHYHRDVRAYQIGPILRESAEQMNWAKR